MFAAPNMFFAGGFTPLSLSPAVWYDASDASTLYDSTVGGSLVAADGTIARWEDKSGNARHATQSTGVSQPIRKTGIQNGKDVVRLDGSNDFLLCNGLASTMAGDDLPISIFAVVKQDITTGLGQVVSARSSATPAIIHGFRCGTAFRYFRNDGTTGKVADGNTSNTNWSLHTVVCSGAAATVRTNATTYASGTDVNVNTLASINECAIGAVPAGANFFDGDFAEILVFASALSDSNRNAVEAYLNSKWAVY